MLVGFGAVVPWKKGRAGETWKRLRVPALAAVAAAIVTAATLLIIAIGFSRLYLGVHFPSDVLAGYLLGAVWLDRLRLTAVCKAQFSQIFSLYSDPDNEVLTLLESREREAIGSVTDADGCVHSLWRVKDSQAIRDVQRQFLDKSLYIADGHHRYTTALAYRKMVREAAGSLPANSPANHIIMYLCPMEDPGLSVLPTHRLLQWPGRMGMMELLNCLDRYFRCEEITGGSRETLIGKVLARMDELERQSPDS